MESSNNASLVVSFAYNHFSSLLFTYKGIKVAEMLTFARRRLLAELFELQKDPPPGIYGTLRDDNIMIWDVTICGPDYDSWQGGIFKLSVEFSEDYPDKPPMAKFLSKMYHPNVFADGTVCLDILGNNWNPIWSAPFLLVAIQSVLCDPFADSAANFKAAWLFVNNRREYNQQISKIVELSWTEESLQFN